MIPAAQIATSKSISPVKAPGLTSTEARHRLASSGANNLPDETLHPWCIAILQLRAPVPWMLEGTIVLELVLGHAAEAVIISILPLGSRRLFGSVPHLQHFKPMLPR